MAFEAYLTLKGATQGSFNGSSTKGRHAGSIAIRDFSFGLESPVDVHSGGATGRRQHKPVVITREVDSASPLLFQALVTNEVFHDAAFEFVSGINGGKHHSIHTIDLINGKIVRITHSPNSGGKRHEKITFDYEHVLVNGLSNVVVHSV
jgi:type VI secretion system secreted protein Hcp